MSDLVLSIILYSYQNVSSKQHSSTARIKKSLKDLTVSYYKH